jgi:hypothetical protein
VSTASGSTARQLLPRVADLLLAACNGPQRPLEHLRTLRHAQWLIERAEVFFVEAARDEGASWSEIARARGTSRQNERQADERRRTEAARDPLDRWLDGQKERFQRERREAAG